MDSALDAIMRALPNWHMRCGGYRPDDLIACDEATAKRAEAVMMAAMAVCDEEGRRAPYRMPPALALAIVDILAADDPIMFARSLSLRKRGA